MSNPVKESLNVAEALGMRHSLSTSRNFNKVIWAIDPFLGYPIEFLSQFGIKQDLLDYKEEWLEKREDYIRQSYGTFSYLTPMGNSFFVNKDLSGNYTMCFVDDGVLQTYKLTYSYFLKSDAVKLNQPSYKIDQDKAVEFSRLYGEYLDFYEKNINSGMKLEAQVIKHDGKVWGIKEAETNLSFPNHFPSVYLKEKEGRPISTLDERISISLLHLFNETKNYEKKHT